VIDFSHPVGPATHARRHLHPTERLLWATFGPVLNYDVDGLTRLGQPDRNAIRKVGEGVGGFILDGLIDGDGGSDRPADPQVIAFGDHAPEFLRGLAPEAFRVWALTSHRLMVIHRPRIAGFTVAKRRRKPCFRLSLVDGSGVDFVLDGKNPEVFGWMLALTNGTA
jgi:hypothetical protein